MQKLIEKASILTEALPYIKEFSGKTFVIKYGGSAMIDENLKKGVIRDIVLMKYIGIKPVIIHGGGKHVSDLMKKLGKEAVFVSGLRVTDQETVEIAEMVLSGLVNKSIVSMINMAGGQAVGISGKDGSTIEGKKIGGAADLGFVGEITRINSKLIELVDSAEFIPVISPIGQGAGGESLNINADTAASEIASALQAEKLIFLTDVNGILRSLNDENSVIPRLDIRQCREMGSSEAVSSGMIPKLNSCIRALEKGVKKIHIINGKIPHSLLLEIFTREGGGTEITAG
ncbi:MAG: acetylglutamate kinase [Spirochaetes bacterium GWF1_41_5]|nr:MAG: acetylglutamate kinase [Spirochaetes bacterium GWF1_41_5]